MSPAPILLFLQSRMQRPVMALPPGRWVFPPPLTDFSSQACWGIISMASLDSGTLPVLMGTLPFSRPPFPAVLIYHSPFSCPHISVYIATNATSVLATILLFLYTCIHSYRHDLSCGNYMVFHSLTVLWSPPQVWDGHVSFAPHRASINHPAHTLMCAQADTIMG